VGLLGFKKTRSVQNWRVKPGVVPGGRFEDGGRFISGSGFVSTDPQ
jgi:hypothetical protein